MYEALIDHIQFARDEARGEDGAVWYLVLSPCEQCKTNPDHHRCAAHPGMVHHYERQAFALDGPKHRPGASADDIANDRANIWKWDGNTSAPTIEPSFLAAHGRPYRMHSYVRGGKLDLCSDSDVTLSTQRSCMMDDM